MRLSLLEDLTISQAFAIFGDKMKSIELCVARFDEETKESFLDLYTKIDEGVDPLAENTSENDDVFLRRRRKLLKSKKLCKGCNLRLQSLYII